MLRKRTDQLHNERGAAMIIVTIVLAVVTTISLGLLLAGYQMFATVNDEGRDEGYYLQAMSFSEVMRRRLEEDTASPGTLEAFIRNFMSDDVNYPVTDASPEWTVTMDADVPDASGNYGAISVRLTKELVTSNTVGEGWEDLLEYDLTMDVTVHEQKGDEGAAGVRSKYLFTYAPDSYIYYLQDDDTKTPLPLSDGNVTVAGKDVSVEALKNNNGVCIVNGVTYHVVRAIKSSGTTYQLRFISFY